MTVVILTTGTGWTVPAGVTSVDAEVWAAGGGGANRGSWPATGGGGGAYSKTLGISVTAGASISYSIGAGGVALTGSGDGNPGGDTWFVSSGTILAKGGAGGLGLGNTAHAGGLGGAASSGIGSVKYSGGAGGSGTTTSPSATGGGSAASSAGNGGNGVSDSTGTATNGGTAPSGGTAGTVSGTASVRNGGASNEGGGGGAGTISTGENGGDGGFPGGGGAGVTTNANFPGGGAGGQIRLTYTASTGITGTFAATTAKPTLAASGAVGVAGSFASTTAKPTMAAAGSITPVAITGTFASTTAKPTMAGAGSIVPPTITGTFASSTSKPTMVAAGSTGSAITGALAAVTTLPSMAASGFIRISGALAASTPLPALSALGSNPYGLSTAASATWFGTTNNLALSSITTGSAAAGMGGSNTLGPDGSPATGWQTAAGVTSSWLLADTGISTTLWRCAGLFRTNLTSAATVRVRIGDAAMSVVAWDSGVMSGLIVPGYQQAVLMMPVDIQGAACRIDLVDTANPDALLNVPLIFAGPLLNSGIGLSYSSGTARTSSETVVRTRAGTEYVSPQYQQRSFAISYSALKAADVYSVLMPIIRLSRTNANTLYIPDAGSQSSLSRQAVYGRLTTAADFTYDQQGRDHRSWQATIRERC